MRLVSQNELSVLTGVDRILCAKRLEGVKFTPGPRKAKMFKSDEALRAILLGTSAGENGTIITPQEAKRQLDIARKQEIDLGMEVTRKERIPIEVLNEVNGQTFDGINGILKTCIGKTFTEENFGDIQALLRDAPSKYKI